MSARRWDDFMFTTAAKVGIPVGAVLLIVGLWLWLVISV